MSYLQQTREDPKGAALPAAPPDSTRSVKIGDVVMLQFEHKPAGFMGFLSADGVISTSLQVIPQESRSLKGANVLIRSCLFRIENARRVNYKKMLKLGTLDSLEKSENELKTALGKPVTYGERIQLRHLHSMGFVSINNHSIATEDGCSQVEVNRTGVENSWFEIVPTNKLRRDGEVVMYSDQVCMQSSADKSTYFLHCFSSSLTGNDCKAEVNASGNPTNWSLCKYIQYDLFAGASQFITTGNSFRIYHRMSEGYLTLKPRGEVSEIVVERGDPTVHALWEIQKTATFVGGVAYWSEKFRVKNVATGLFLCVNGKLVQGGQQESFFTFQPDSDVVEDQVLFDTILSLRAENEAFLSVVDSSRLSESLKVIEGTQIAVTLTTSPESFANLGFLFEDVSEEMTAHVHQIALALPYLESLHARLDTVTPPTDVNEKQTWDSFLKKLARTTSQCVDNLRRQLIDLKEGPVSLEHRQNSMYELGLIESLMRIAVAIHAVQMQDSLRLHPDDDFHYTSGTELQEAQTKIYALVYRGIKGNEESCDGLQTQEADLVQIHSVRPNANISKILREIYKYTKYTLSSDQGKIKEWFKDLQPISAVNKNFDDLILHIDIVRYLCEYQDSGVLKYQNLALAELLNPEKNFTLVYFEQDANGAAVEFNYAPQRLADFLRENPQLEALHKELLVETEKFPKIVVHLNQLSQLDPGYTRYIVSIVELVTNVCLSRNNLAITQVCSKLGITSAKLIDAIHEPDCPVKLKAVYVKLLLVLFIDIDPYVFTSVHQPLCFDLNQNLRRGETHMSKEYFQPFKDLVQEFWRWHEDPIDTEDSVMASLKLIGNYLQLTRALIDLDTFADVESTELLNTFNAILSQSTTSTWVSRLISRLNFSAQVSVTQRREGLGGVERKLARIKIAILDTTKTIWQCSLTSKLEQIFSVFVDWKSRGPAQEESRFDPVAIEGVKNILEGVEPEKEAFAADGEELPPMKQLSDLLLEQLYRTSAVGQEELKDSILSMLLNTLNEKKIIWQQLRQIELLTDANLTKLFEEVVDRRAKLYSCGKTLYQCQQDETDSKSTPTFVDSVKQAVAVLFDLQSFVIVQRIPGYKTEKYQNLLRHSGIHFTLIRLLKLRYSDSIKILFRHTIKVLYIFCLKNPVNQDLLFDSIDRIIELIGYGCGATQLLGEVLSRHRHTPVSQRLLTQIISVSGNSVLSRRVQQILSRDQRTSITQLLVNHLFTLIEHPENHHFVNLLETFVRDERGVYIPKLQVEILKGLFNNRTVRQMHTHEGALNFLQPQLQAAGSTVKQKKKFSVAVFQCMIACTSKNQFSIMQGRTVVPFVILQQAIRNPEVDLHFRKLYLRYMFEVYMVDVDTLAEPLFTINNLFDLFNEVILPDLRKFAELLPTLVPLARHNLYQNIRSSVQLVNKSSVFRSLISHMKFEELGQVDDHMNDKKLLADNDIPLTPNDRLTLKYWNYLSGHEQWFCEKDGLLHVLIDMFASNSEPLSSPLITVTRKIAEVLEQLVNALSAQEQLNPELDFSNLILLVNRCLEGLTTSEEAESTELDLLLYSMREYIIANRRPIEEIFTLFDVDGNGDIEKKEFIDTVARILTNVRPQEVELAFSHLDANSDGTVKFSEFSRVLREKFQKGKHQQRIAFQPLARFDPELVEDQEIKAEFLTTFLNGVKPQFKGNSSGIPIEKLRQTLMENNVKGVKGVLHELGQAFGRKVDKIHMLMLLTNLINSNQGENFRLLLSQAGAMQHAVELINEENDFMICYKAVKLLLALLDTGNREIQHILLTLLKTTQHKLFAYIRTQLRMSRDRVVDQLRQDTDKPDQPQEEVDEELDRFGYLDQAQLDRYASNHVVDLVFLIQLCSDNCNEQFQLYFLSQEDPLARRRPLSINLVLEITQFLINVKDLRHLILENNEAERLIDRCLKTLIDLCRGPCVENQKLIGTRRKVYNFINEMLGLRKDSFPRYLTKLVHLLKALLEGHVNMTVAELMLAEIRFEDLAAEAISIYRDHIHNNVDKVLQAWVEGEGQSTSFINALDQLGGWMFANIANGGLPKHISRLIATGFDIVIITLKLKDKFPTSTELNYLNFTEEAAGSTANFQRIVERVRFLGGREENLLRASRVYCEKRMRPEVFTKDTPIDAVKDTAFEFYLSLIATVEIDRDGAVELCYFRVPSMITFLSPSAKRSILNSINRNSQEEKLKSFLRLGHEYQEHMNHLQLLSRYGWIAWWASKYKSIGTLCYLIILVINIILLSTISDQEELLDSSFAIFLLGIILIIFAGIGFAFFLVENSPLMISAYLHAGQKVDIYNKPEFTKVKGTVLMKDTVDLYRKLTSGPPVVSTCKKVRVVMMEKNSVYHIVYILLAIFGLAFSYFCFAILLLDILRRSDDLQNILRAITQNRLQLALTALLGLIVVYLFSIAGFLWLGEYYSDDDTDMFTYCHNLFECLLTTLTVGVRAGGGLGEMLLQPERADDNYDLRQVFDILFFILVIIILLNIIFGIIIDTFAELRDQRKEIEQDNQSVCLICGGEKNQFERSGNGWTEHIQIEHNAWSYLAYVIYIKTKQLPKCDGIEKLVKNKVEHTDVTFFPQTALCLLQDEEAS